MTLVAVWHAEKRLMAIADTRISRSSDVLTEHGPKILPITIRCLHPGRSGFFDREAWKFDIGFAYSGASLPALSAQALANTFLGNLIGPPSAPPPSIAEIAQSISDISEKYMLEVGQISGRDACFKAIIFGFCPIERRLRAFEMKPDLVGSPLTCSITEHDLQAPHSIAIIGSCPELLREQIESDRAEELAAGGLHHISELDRPTRALQVLIATGAHPSVGGMIQQGWATEFGFEIVAKVMPTEVRPPSTRNTGLFALGYDVLDLAQIGKYAVRMTGR